MEHSLELTPAAEERVGFDDAEGADFKAANVTMERPLRPSC